MDEGKSIGSVFGEAQALFHQLEDSDLSTTVRLLRHVARCGDTDASLARSHRMPSTRPR